jgi:hypothetical protein
VLAHRLEAAAEVDALRAAGDGEELGERRRQRLARVERAEEVLVRSRWRRRSSGRISSRIRPRFVSRLVESVRNARPRRGRYASVSSRQSGRERMDDTVVVAGLDPGRRPARDEAVEDRLDLVRGGVAGRTELVTTCHLVSRLAELPLGEAAPSASTTSAPSTSTQKRRPPPTPHRALVVHVDRRNGVAELAEGAPEARRVGAARDEARDLAARRDESCSRIKLSTRLQQLVHQKINER